MIFVISLITLAGGGVYSTSPEVEFSILFCVLR